MNAISSDAGSFSFELPEYRFVPLSNVFEQSTEVQWLIEDYIPKQSVGMLYGPSGAGKSHIVLDMAARVANGIPWCDKETEKGVVLVMAGEGQNGLKRRLQSIEKQHELTIDRSNIFFSERATGVDTDKGFNELVAAIEALDEYPDLIIVDTLSRHLMSSSENSNEDMASVINKLEQIKQRYSTSILIVHHTGKNASNGSRGASSIRANIDFSLVLSQQEVGGRKFCKLDCEKQKDANDNIPTVGFMVVPVELDEKDSKGRPVQGACVRRVSFQRDTDDKIYESLALDTFASEKSEWQKSFLKAFDEELDVEFHLDTKKKKFRDQVKLLVRKGLIIEVEKNKFSKSD